jgi:hypothetical protein
MSKHKPDWDEPVAQSDPETEPEPAPAGPKTVRIRGVGHAQPFLDETRRLLDGDEAEVSEEIAKVLIKRGQAEPVK